MVGAVIFDCDGVLLDSNSLKIDLFRETVIDHGFAPADVERFSAFQAANFGTSRYRLFEILLEWKLAVRPAVDRETLVAHFAALLQGRYAAAPDTPGMREVVAELATRLPVFIASGSDEAELRNVFVERGDADAFDLILGSPTGKADNVATILKRLAARTPPIAAGDVVFVGDAEADWQAASRNGTRFVYMDGFSTAQERMRKLATEQGFPVINDLRELPLLLTHVHTQAEAR